jgi:hypothetical protein
LTICECNHIKSVHNEDGCTVSNCPCKGFRKRTGKRIETDDENTEKKTKKGRGGQLIKSLEGCCKAAEELETEFKEATENIKAGRIELREKLNALKEQL